MNQPHGYTFGTAAVAVAPITLEELKLIQQSLLFSEDDVMALRQSRAILQDQIEDVLDVWYGFVGATPQLLTYFTNPTNGQPDGEYLAGVRKRFGQWILDTAAADYDQRWLNYQFEIGRRHHRVGKNQTDGAQAAPHIHYRYLPALLYPITTTLKPVLAKQGHSAEEVEKMQQAWVKSVLLQVILWSYPYVKDGDF